MFTKKSLLSMLLLLPLFFTACEKKQEEKIVEKKPIAIDVNTYIVERKTYPIWIDFSGKTEAFEKVEITSRVSGELKDKFFSAGDFVKKDKLLFKIDDSKYKTILAQKKATLEKDQASLNLATATVNRYKPLIEKGLAPKEKLDELEAQEKQLKAVVQADNAAINEANLNLSYTNIKATIDGQVGKALVDIGNIITTSSKLAKVVQSSTLYVNFSPSSNEVGLFKKYSSQEKSEVRVIQKTDEKSNIITKGHVDFIDNVTDANTGTVAMRAKIDNNENLLFPGTFVKIKLFITDQIPIIAVAPNVLGQNQLGAFVFVVNNENKIETRQLEINYSNESLLIIKKGLEVGDKVIVSDITKLKDGMIVKTNTVSNPIIIK